MKIKEMFRDDINRNINGVVQVEQEKEEVIEQEVREYVVTTELKKHFTKFFSEYGESFENQTDNVGVWITGFFGSGKSHFLKMLSYLLENKEINGRKTVDYFEEKFDDQLSFMNVQKCVQAPTETILFNIDVEGSTDKSDTAVLKIFAKVFYNHLGFYGNDLKLAKLEQFITKQGKMDAFKKAYEEINGESWLDTRSDYQFFEEDVIDALVQENVMSEEAAKHWFDGTETADISIGQLVDEIKAYVDTKPKDFRLLFMIDEAGQYIGTNTSMLLNLQTLIEKLGSVCRGQVWVVATGQEALDEMIKMRADEFSRIMARFAIRLSLTSSSVDEVIEKRLLTKTDEANIILTTEYDNNENILKNLYAFDTELKDLKGYTSSDEFVRIFPFVPYQFTIMQKVFNEVRKHGHAGKHQSSGERSMLNGFQESAQRIENKDELTLVPMYAFYDTLHSFLDTSVRQVVERSEKAALEDKGLTNDDVNLLKLLYLIRYIDDIKSNIENLTILMADKINVDKILLRGKVTESLERLQKQNYISRNGDVYQFLTDEEQDIAREISNQTVDAANVISYICKIIFDDIYTIKKYRYTKNGYQNDFDFDKAVDEQNHGNTTGGMKLRFITEANDSSELKLIADSKSYEAICKLSTENSVFTDLENVLKIDKFIKQKNINQLSQSIQDIITNKQRESRRLQNEAKDKLSEAIIKGKFYIDGTNVNLSGANVKAILDNALEILVEHTYSGLSLIDDQTRSEEDVRALLKGEVAEFDGFESNKLACDEIYNYLDTGAAMGLHFTMADIQSRYQNIPYGWSELDVVYVVAKLIFYQRVTIKHSGQTIQPSDYKLVDYLRKKSEISSTSISIREIISASKMKKVKDILKEYFDVMDIPSDEDSLVKFVVNKFSDEKVNLEMMNDQNASAVHPGSQEISNALSLIKKVLLAQNDNIALVDAICNLEDGLLDSKEDMQSVKNFYATQVKLFDNAVSLKHNVECNENDYLMNIPEIANAIDRIKDITKITINFRYNRIPELNDCISIINTERNKVVENKKQEVIKLIDDCYNEVVLKANTDEKLQLSLDDAKQQFDAKKQETNRINSLVILDAKKNTIVSLKDNIINQMDSILNQAHSPITSRTPAQPVSKKKVRELQRVVVFNQASLTNAQDVEDYLAKIRSKLLSYINDDEEIKIK